MFTPNPPGDEGGSEEMMIVPEKPPLSEPTWVAALVTPSKVSKAGAPTGSGTFPTCVTKIGIDVDGGETPTVVNVALLPETAAETKSLGETWPKTRMVPALAEVGRPSKAAHPKTRMHDKSRAKIGGLVKDPS